MLTYLHEKLVERMCLFISHDELRRRRQWSMLHLLFIYIGAECERERFHAECHCRGELNKLNINTYTKSVFACKLCIIYSLHKYECININGHEIRTDIAPCCIPWALELPREKLVSQLLLFGPSASCWPSRWKLISSKTQS